ncbi:MAG: methyltransferase domain-containing protein [Rhodospirillales bacterium]|nr:methyltransferase domain-containing protein [Rhodospirillales bacterium]
MASNFKALNPEGYERIMGRFSRRLARSFLDFTGSGPAERILNVGCGTGSMTAALAERGDHAAIVGIDVSEPYVAFARARNADPRTTFDIGDVTALPYPSEHFDRAVSQLVLMFIPDPYPAVAEMRRVVRPGGKVAACTWDAFGGQPHLRMLYDTASALGLDRSRSLFWPLNTGGELEAMCARPESGRVSLKRRGTGGRASEDWFRLATTRPCRPISSLRGRSTAHRLWRRAGQFPGHRPPTSSCWSAGAGHPRGPHPDGIESRPVSPSFPTTSCHQRRPPLLESHLRGPPHTSLGFVSTVAARSATTVSTSLADTRQPAVASNASHTPGWYSSSARRSSHTGSASNSRASGATFVIGILVAPVRTIEMTLGIG